MRNLLTIIVFSFILVACGDGNDDIYGNEGDSSDDQTDKEVVDTDGDKPEGYCDSHSDCGADERCDFKTNRCVKDVDEPDYEKPDHDTIEEPEDDEEEEKDEEPDAEEPEEDEVPDTDEFWEGCGNGVVEPWLGEACDKADFGEGIGAYCSDDCSAITGRCGDGVVQENEACDEGNTKDGPYCSADCKEIVGSCGDGIKQSNEVCDKAEPGEGGGEGIGAYCSDDCKEVTGSCGDGTVQENEACDDGENNGKYGYCSKNCDGPGPHCGDGTVNKEFDEVCDKAEPGEGNGEGIGAYCNDDCSEIVGSCGDGTLQDHEVCDKANHGDGIGAYCSDDCQEILGECGDGTVQDHEECDEGENNSTKCEYGVQESCMVCNHKCKWQAGELTYCGDDKIDTANGEMCDDGEMNGEYNHCGEFCQGPGPRCGDDIVDDPHEVCDDGSTNGMYGYCKEDCSGMGPHCGDGNVDSPREECDDGNDETEECEYGQQACTVCTASCESGPGIPNYCGDGKVNKEEGEVCDNGEEKNGTYGYCKEDCSGMGPYCGDGILQSEKETCDDGDDNGKYGFCKEDCSGIGPHCGDGIVHEEYGEDCDLGDDEMDPYCPYGQTEVCYVCNENCENVLGENIYCGDGELQGEHGEECDLGSENGNYDSGCDSECKTGGPHCGDGIKQATYENCDHGENNGEYGYCKADCSEMGPYCGDDTIQDEYGEICDDGGNNSDSWSQTKHCNTDCSDWAPYCGDNTIDETHEECDDGENNGEYGYCNETCSGPGSRCGDGIVHDGQGEECDDGNDSDNDDCKNDCTWNVCGDGVLHFENEECDKGDLNGNEICDYDTTCEVCDSGCNAVPGETSTCGDGTLHREDCTGYESEGCVEVSGADETCDDGVNNGEYGYCNETCDGPGPHCGDGVANLEHEECDDGVNNGEYGYCNETCDGYASHCGDGTVDGEHGEICDDGENNGEYGYCNETCDGYMPYCGDGILHRDNCPGAENYGDTGEWNGMECVKTAGVNEFCDDGDTNNDDWSVEKHCNANCTDWAPYCGDETVDGPDEVCDSDFKSCNEIHGSYIVGKAECAGDCSEYNESTCGTTFLPDTGQTTCYNNTSSIICPSEGEPFYGQDANYVFGVQGYIRSETLPEEPVITNTWFGFQWQDAVPETEYTYSEAATYCNNLSYVGIADWHLPEFMLAGLSIDVTSHNPAVDTDYFADMPSAGFWTTDAYYLIDTSDGSLFAGDSVSKYRVRCKRNTGDFYFSSDDIVFDDNGTVVEQNVQTGMSEFVLQRIWESDPAGGIDNWENALYHCENLNLNGKSDWRLPDMFELSSLIDISQANPSSSMPAIDSATYWTATTYSADPGKAWIVDFTEGHSYEADKDGSTHTIMCVRDER